MTIKSLPQRSVVSLSKKLYALKIKIKKPYLTSLITDNISLLAILQHKAPVTLSRFKPQFTTTHPDLRQMVKSGCIGMRRDGKKEIPASMRCLTMLLRCLHDSSTDPLRLMTAALRFTRVELRMLTMPPRFDTVLVRFKPVALRPPTNVHDLVVVMRQS